MKYEEYDPKYSKYALKVINGEINAGKYIKQACQRYLNFFEKYDFKPDRCDRVINFISKLKHYTGSFNGKPFELQEYQKWIIYSIFGFYNGDKRVTKYVYFEVARKNGKTAFVAAICLYMLISDGEHGSEVELVANSAKQAKIAFDMSSRFLRSIDSKDKYFKRYRDTIKFDKMDALLQVLSSDASGNDGYNAYCFCLDEAHEQRDSKLWDVMVSSQGMRKNPLGIITTTAGFNKFGFCYNYRQSCINILNNSYDEDCQFAAIYTLDEGDDWENPDVWIKANPSLGITVQPDFLQDTITKAKNNPSSEVGAKTKNFNVWCDSQEGWLSYDDVNNSCKHLKDLATDLSEAEIYCGVDLSAVSDLTAVSTMFVLPDKVIFKNRYYLPQTCLENNPNKELYKKWHRMGYLTLTEGNVVDYDYITNDMLKDNLQIQKVAYDSYNATQWAIDAEGKGLPLEPFSQSLGHFNKPTKEFERLLRQGKVIIEDNEITKWCISNVSLQYDHNENCKPVKTSKMQKIDGVIAMLQALGIYLESPHWNNIIG